MTDRTTAAPDVKASMEILARVARALERTHTLNDVVSELPAELDDFGVDAVALVVGRGDRRTIVAQHHVDGEAPAVLALSSLARAAGRAVSGVDDDRRRWIAQPILDGAGAIVWGKSGEGGFRPEVESLLAAVSAQVGLAAEAERIRSAALASADESAARLAFAIDAAGMIAWEWDERTGMVSHTFNHITRQGEVQSRDDYATRMHPNDRERVRAAFDLSAREGKDYSQDYRLLDEQGDVRWVMSRGRPMRGPDGARRMSGVLVDITDRRRAELALAASERRFRAVFNEQVQFMALLDPEGRVTDIADSTLAQTGVGRADVIGRRLWEAPFWVGIDFEDDRRILQGAIAVACKGDAPAPFEVGFLWGESVRRGAGTIKAVRDETGEIDFLIAQSNDVTERATRAAAMAQANAELRERVADGSRALADEVRRREATQAALMQAQRLEALGRLTGGVAHDFNNLLAAVIGAFNLIQRTPSPERVSTFAAQGVIAAQRGVHLVRQLRAFARRDALTVVSLDLRERLQQTLVLIRHTVGPGVEVTLDVDGDLWPIWADENQLDVALLNLAANARDAMREQGSVIVRARNVPHPQVDGVDGAAVVVTMQDSGGGMRPDVLARAVEPFFTTKEPGGAPGLGLAMVHGFAQQIGGALVLENVTGGLAAHLYLRRAIAPASAPSGPLVAPQTMRADVGLRVLLVDDDAAVRPVIASLLEDLGYEVTAADGAAQARAAASTTRFDFVLTDVVMPGGDGVGLAADLRAADPTLPVFFMTGHVRDENRLEGERVLRKPFTAEDLAAFLTSARALA